MENLNRDDAIVLLLDYPIEIGHALGFTKLEALHDNWIRQMVIGEDDETLQAHRGSYKTTCVSIALAIIMVALPDLKILFMRKTDDDVKEIVAQVKKILLSDVMQAIVYAIYGIYLELTKDSSNELSTNLCANDPRGTSQLVAIGISASLTGKHYDRIFTDDIVNIKDRYSKAEREQTKRVYQELRNLINRGGKIFNTGTPWHKDDAFALMPNPQVWAWDKTGLISHEEIAIIREGMTASLFSANYEMRHIASEDVIFKNPDTDNDPALAEQGRCHIDASYGGEDSTAFTICHKIDGEYYIFGKLWHKHVDDCMDDAIKYQQQFNAGRISMENNGDKGYLSKAFKAKGIKTHEYHENMNKQLKIETYLKSEWAHVHFVAGTDPEYIEQIEEFNENVEHDDAPDSCASAIREQWKKKGNRTGQTDNINLMYL